MNEKPESADEFEDEDAEEVAGGDEALDVDRLIQDLDKRKRGAPKGAAGWMRTGYWGVRCPPAAIVPIAKSSDGPGAPAGSGTAAPSRRVLPAT